MMKTITALLLVVLPVLLICSGNSPDADQMLSAPATPEGGVYYVAPGGDDDVCDFRWEGGK